MVRLAAAPSYPLPTLKLGADLTCCLPSPPLPYQAIKLVIKVLSKTMDSTTLSPEKVELATLARDEEEGKVGAGSGGKGGWVAVGGDVRVWIDCCGSVGR